MALVASACGGNDDDDSGAGGVAAEATAAPDAPSGGDDPPAPSGDGDGGGDAGSGDQDGDSQADQGGESSGAEETPAQDGGEAPLAPAEPQYGGTLTFGLEAETNNGWNPVTAQPAVSGHIVLRSMYDTLTTELADGTVAPYLLESFSSNDDFTEWTLTMRPGITFHDGLPADSVAVQRHFEELQKGVLTGLVFSDVELQEVQIVDDLTAKVILGRPVAVFPDYLTAFLGYLASPAMYDLGEDSARNPIGTGPYMLDEWVPNEVTRVVRNPNYWRTDAEGRQLPYLDAIEFRPIPDSDTRFAALRSGDLDASVDNTGTRIEEYTEEFNSVWEPQAYGNVTYLMFNNQAPPFDNVEFRRALAQCTDRQTYNNLRWDGQPPANGPFSVGTPGYLEDSGFPTYDPDAGRAVIERLGISEVELGTTNDSANLLSTELLAEMWRQCGIDVSITQVDQAELINNAIFGLFTAFLWRNHNGFELALERSWWHSKYSRGIAINFGRITDDRIDAALDEAFVADDPEASRALAEEVNRVFADQVYNLWFYFSNWVVGAQDYVRGVDELTLPEGGERLTLMEGRAFLGEVWLDQ
ncbi:ABC transporter substrate-binding protein [Candidatus Poriferisocius sp.]|uniref:ABC transporter substrate-binding protein n=1 Tax=Candidatus Poriferisocius sp. TaxID=3101276 RepID=UPI003B5C7121